jgi:pimeloyl-[acyl-carrier protein] methyl ester esterase
MPGPVEHHAGRKNGRPVRPREGIRVSLYRDSSGQGPDVALLHGWGLHGGVFGALATALAPRFRVHVLDLPGHGRSPWAKGAADLEGLARLVALHLPQTCSLVGWSLGGMVAVRLATLFPARVPRLALIATSPCGAKRRDWPQGLDDSVLAGLASRLGRDWRGTVQDFVALEVRGEEDPLATLRELKRQLHAHGAPSTAALAAGLEILRSTDLRPELPRLRSQTLAIAGEYDRLAAPAAVAALAALVPGARYELIARAAHAPFLSHREHVESLLGGFLAAP